jgi:hypothetical protein
MQEQQPVAARRPRARGELAAATARCFDHPRPSLARDRGTRIMGTTIDDNDFGDLHGAGQRP